MNRNHRHRPGAWADAKEQQHREVEAVNFGRQNWPNPPIGVSRPAHAAIGPTDEPTGL